MKSNSKFIRSNSRSFDLVTKRARIFSSRSLTFKGLLFINDLIRIIFVLAASQVLLAQANQSSTLNRHKNADHKILQQQQQPLSTPIATTTTLTVENIDYFHESSYKYLQRPQVSTNITAKVGETITLYCAINSSYGLNPGV
jgi:hypothetical protein